MSTLGVFFDAAKAALTLGPKTDAAGRQEIRDVVGQLADELDRALSLADSYLAGVAYAENDLALVQYLQGGHGRLMGNFREHNVYAAMTHLADKFGQVFDPAKFTVSLDSHADIPKLIRHLADHERAVLDDLAGMDQQLQGYAAKLGAANDKQAAALKKDIAKSAEYHRHEFAEQRKKLKAVRRRLIDEL